MSALTIVRSLLYLRVTSLRNLLVSRIKRLKQPKYLLGAVAGIAYFYMVFGRRFRSGQSPRMNDLVDAASVDLSSIATFGAALLLIFIVLYWLWPRERAALSFTEPEIAFLFPAPVSRKALIHYRLFDLQFRLLFTSLVLAFISAPWGIMQEHFLLRMLGWWLIFVVVSLHAIGASFVLTKWLDRGMNTLRRQIAVLMVVAVIAIAAAAMTWQTWRAPTLDEMSELRAFINYLDAMLNSGPLGVVLLPLKWLVQPLLTSGTPSFFVALVPALAVGAAHYFWVLYSEVSFEESSIARAEKRAVKIAAMRAGNFRFGKSVAKARHAPFELSKVPRVELAFLWKNLLSTADYLKPRTLLRVAIVVAALCYWLTHSDHEVIVKIISVVTMAMSAYIFIFGPALARQDLRSDLLNADILKVYPLRGWQVVLGEVLTPIMVLTMILWLMLLIAAMTFQPEHVTWLTSGVRIAATFGIALLIPLLLAVQVLVLNASAILFPAWTQLGGGAGGGIDVMGQRLLFMASTVLAVVIALIPATVVAGILSWIVFLIAGVFIAVPFAVLLFIATLCAELGLCIGWLGMRFEKLDLSAELRS